MTGYRVEFHAKADAETLGLLPEPFTALIETLVFISRDPWTNSAEDRPVGDSTFRWAMFGGLGVVQFRIDDQARAIQVYGITWTG